MTDTNYCRVIPRDFFNESKLLKCFGQLSLKILDYQLPNGIDIKIEESGESFEIDLTDDGDLIILNYPATINDKPVLFKSRYNNKSPFPFYCEVDYTDFKVFDDNGEFAQEFIEMFTNY